MATPDMTSKRRNIASRAVDAATKLLDAQRELEALQQEHPTAGNFVDSDPEADPPVVGDFEGTDLAHLDAYTIGTLLDNVVPAIGAVVNASPQIDVLMKVRK